MMKKLLVWTAFGPVLVSLLALLALLVSNPALAHGSAKARHGGVAVMASDLGFELVATPAGAAIYIEDHGKPLPPTGVTGKLTVLNGTERSEAELSVAGDKLEARGVKLNAGARAVAALTMPNKKVVTVRFTVR